MTLRSLSDYFLFILGFVPSDDKITKLRNAISGIPLTILSLALSDHRNKAAVDRFKLIKNFRLKRSAYKYITNNLPSTKTDLWSKLRYCGSGITKEMFGQTEIKGKSKSELKILKGHRFSSEFIDRFKWLWERDKILRRIEWDYLKIGRMYNRDKLMVDLDQTTMGVLKQSSTLMDLISELRTLNSSAPLVRSIAKSLIYRAKHDIKVPPYEYQLGKKWLKKDPYYSISILARSLELDGYQKTENHSIDTIDIVMKNTESRFNELSL